MVTSSVGCIDANPRLGKSRRSLVPHISPLLFRWFSWYGERFVRRNMHCVRVMGEQHLRQIRGPLLIYTNHPSWWDPMLALVLANQFWPNRSHYAAIDESALKKYRFFGRLGFFGIEPNTYDGAARFLATGTEILSAENNVLWITAQGRFADVRERPLVLARGISHLARKSNDITVLPVAIEYSLWEERYPEALVAFGEPLIGNEHSGIPVADLHQQLQRRLESALDQLAACSIARSRSDFRVLTQGAAGVGGVYDVWRRLRAAIRGHRFRAEHGEGTLSR